MTKRRRLLAAALGTAGLLSASTISVATSAQAAVPTSPTIVRAADECWSGVGGVTCVSEHRTHQACDYGRHQKRAEGYRPSDCVHNPGPSGYGPWYFLY